MPINIVLSGRSISKKRSTSIKFLMPISLGLTPSSSQCGEKLKATLQFLEQNYQHSELCIVLVDTLYRHTLPEIYPGETKDALTLRAAALGTDWLLGNQALIDSIKKIKIEIKRWDDYIQDADYSTCEIEITKLYIENEKVKTGIDQTAKLFFSKAGNAVTPEGVQLDQNRVYLKEEGAVFLLWLKKHDYEYLLYPAKKTPALEVYYDHLRTSEKGLLLEFEQIRFKGEKDQASDRSFFFNSEKKINSSLSCCAASDPEMRIQQKAVNDALICITSAVWRDLRAQPADLRVALISAAAQYTAVVAEELLGLMKRKIILSAPADTTAAIP